MKSPESSVQKKPLPDTKPVEPSGKKPLPEAKSSSTPTNSGVKENKISKNRIGELEQVLKNKGIQPEVIHVLYRVNSLEELSEAKYQNIMDHLKEIKERQDMQRT